MQEIKRLCLATALLVLAAATTVFAQGGPEDIRLTVGKSIVIDYPADIARISTSNPDIVDAARSRRAKCWCMAKRSEL